jgi:hypothetical protein
MTLFRTQFKTTLITGVLILASGITGGISTAHANQVCPVKGQTTPTENFITQNNNPEYVIDSTTGLAWSRCVVGQTWNSASQSCTGEPLRLTWQEALQAATNYTVGNITEWRLPNIKELASIVERECVDPAVNLVIFPNAPSQHYWSSTPNTAGNKIDEAWAVAFYNGRLDSNKKSSDFFVRMVRYAE